MCAASSRSRAGLLAASLRTWLCQDQLDLGERHDGLTSDERAELREQARRGERVPVHRGEEVRDSEEPARLQAKSAICSGVAELAETDYKWDGAP